MERRSRASAYRGPWSYADPYYCEWGAVVGDRVRRLRRDRDLTLAQFARTVLRPARGEPYSAGYFSRLERGSAKAPLFTYLAIADALEVDAGVMLGPDTASLTVSDGEMVLLQYLRGAGLQPHEALAGITHHYARATAIDSSSPSIRAESAPAPPTRPLPPPS